MYGSYTVPRRPRGLIVDSFVHVTNRGNRGEPLYFCDQDFRFFLRGLRDSATRYSARVHAYCLMTNHFHLVLEARDEPISHLMHAVLQRHAQYINRIYDLRGHVFGDRFWARPCQNDEDLVATIRYIHLNPVRARLVHSPERYPWSTHGVYLGACRVPWVQTTLLDFFTLDRARAVELYDRFVRDDMMRPKAVPGRRTNRSDQSQG